MKVFFLVLARDEKHVVQKIQELKVLAVPFLIVCGSKLNYPNVIYRAPRGKFDAINFGFRFIPEDIEVVVLNDVDTSIKNFEAALSQFQSDDIALLFVKLSIKEGPQRLFSHILDQIRRTILVTAAGELMLIRYEVLKKIVPIPTCKAEDSYLLFKVLELGYKCTFCEKCYVETERTKTFKNEELYKRRTVCGIYQALSCTNPPCVVKIFYALLPLFSPLLLFFGKKGYFWMKGILGGLIDYLRGDKGGVWSTY